MLFNASLLIWFRLLLDGLCFVCLVGCWFCVLLLVVFVLYDLGVGGSFRANLLVWF